LSRQDADYHHTNGPGPDAHGHDPHHSRSRRRRQVEAATAKVPPLRTEIAKRSGAMIGFVASFQLALRQLARVYVVTPG